MNPDPDDGPAERRPLFELPPFPDLLDGSAAQQDKRGALIRRDAALAARVQRPHILAVPVIGAPPLRPDPDDPDVADILYAFDLEPWQVGLAPPPRRIRWRAPFVRAWLKLTGRW